MTAPAVRDRILQRATVAGIALNSTEVEQLGQYYELLERWNRTINLTALPLVGYPDRAIDHLILEPIAAAALIGHSVIEWFDLGSGGGSPAIPLKVVRPNARLMMVESRSRKSAFLREVVRTMGLLTASVWTGRLEHLTEHDAVGTVELVTVRAIRVDAALLGVAASLLASGGRFGVFGTSVRPETGPFPFEYDSSTRLLSSNHAVHWLIRTSHHAGFGTV